MKTGFDKAVRKEIIVIEIAGEFATAVVYAEDIEDSAKEQIEILCNQSFAEGARIRIMPDVHAGAGCVIGFTGNLGERVIPNIVGVDIGCGMLTVELGPIDVDFEELNRIVRDNIPSGKQVHEGRLVRFSQLSDLYCFRALRNTKRIERSIGTLGGGNHFIEIDVDDQGSKYLIIHTGSRNLGKQVADYYQEMAFDIMCGKDKYFETRDQIIQDYKESGRKHEIQQAIHHLAETFEYKKTLISKELCYLEGKYREMYLHDMKICQDYATLNRMIIAQKIVEGLLGKNIEDLIHFETIHNYIDHERNLVRKGAVSAKKGETLLIPMNMRDGSLLCVGKGNDQWNSSAPHGAGRLFSRTAAKERFDLEEYQTQMEGIYSTTVSEKTLDECPMAYKGMDDILGQIEPTAEVVKIIKPIYNFKAEE